MLAGIVMFSILAGCQVDLYSNLSEQEANQMLAVLMASGIPAQKSSVGDAFVVRVREDDIGAAITTLTAKGFPKNTRASIGTVFEKSGIISSPFEERVRYIYVLGEEVAKTLGEIDGVVTTRVHVVLPEQPQLGQPVAPSSAAVFIKHEPSVDLEFFVPQIRRLVSSAIEGLEYSAVTVILTEAAPSEVIERNIEEHTVAVLPGLAVREADVPYFWRLVYGTGATMALLVATTIAGFVSFLLARRRRKASGNALVTTETETALEPS